MVFGGIAGGVVVEGLGDTPQRDAQPQSMTHRASQRTEEDTRGTRQAVNTHTSDALRGATTNDGFRSIWTRTTHSEQNFIHATAWFCLCFGL